MMYSAIQQCLDLQTVRRVDGTILSEKSVYVKRPQAKSGFCLYLNDRFEVKWQGDGIWIEKPDTVTPIIRAGRPVEREGRYQRITLEIREDLLAKIDQSGKSRREFIEMLLQK